MNIYDEVNKIANGNARLKNSKLNNGSNSSIYDEMSQLSNKKMKLKNNSTLSNTIQEKMDNLWVEEKTNAPSINMFQKQENTQPTIKDMVNNVINSPEVKKATITSKANELEKQIKQKEQEYNRANNIRDWNQKSQTQSQIQQELNKLRTELNSAKEYLNGFNNNNLMSIEQVEENNKNAPLLTKIDKAIKYDIPKTAEKVGRTGMDLIGNVATGVTKGMEGYVDAGIGAGGTVLSNAANLVGKKELAQNIKNKAEEIAGYGFAKDMQSLVDEKSREGAGIYNPSVLGMDVRDAAQEIARMYAVAVTGGLPGLMVSASGGNIEEALNEGQSLGRATAYGAISGSLEGIVEKMFDPAKILGGGLKTIGKGFLGKIAEATVGEGAEEGITAALNPFIKMLTYKGDVENPFGSWDNFKNYLRDIGQSVYQGAIIGGLTLGVSAPGNVDLQNSFKDDVHKAVEKIQGINQTRKDEIANTIIEGATQAENIEGLPKNEAQNQVQGQEINPTNTITPNQAKTPQNANMEQITDNNKNKLLNKIKNNQYMSQEEKNDLIAAVNNTNITSEVETEINNILNIINEEFGLKNITSDFNSNKAKYAQYANDKSDMDNSYIDNSKNAIDTKDGRRTKDQWLSIAKNLGSQIYEMPDAEIEKYAYRTWIENKPNNVQNLNRQGKKYIKFGLDEWVNTVYDSVRETRNRVAENPINTLPTQKAQETLHSKNYMQKDDNDLSVNTQYAQENENDTAGKEPVFSMQKNQIQSFASSTAPRPYMDLNRYTSRNSDSKTEKVGLTDIQKAINDIVTVKTGKFRQQAYGIYKTNNEIIRLKETKDIPVALHELTHHLDKKYNLSSSDKAFKELESIAVTGKNPSKQTVIKEGVAEFGRYYMTDKEYAKEIAPFYYDAFERALDNDPDMKSKVDNIRQMVSDYLEQSPLNRLSSNIDYGDNDMSLWEKGKESIIKTAKNFRKNFVDELDPLKKIVEEISSGDKLMTKENAYKLLRLNNGVTGKVQVALEYGVLDKNGEKVGKSLKEILKPVAGQQKEFVAYVTALRAKDLQGRGIESGILPKDVDDVIKSYNTNEKFNLAAKELYQFQNKILETTLIDSGIITREALEAYNKNNPHYVPFYRVMDENFKQSKSSKSKTPKRIKGSTRDIINPLESIIKNTYSYMQMAERNDAFKTLFDMANKYDGTGKWFDKVPADITGTKITAENVKGILEQLNLSEEDVNYNEIFTTIFKPANNQKGNIVTVMEKGKPVHYEINDKELFDILSPTVKGENIIVKLLSPASKALRVGATHTPEFVLRNPLRDTIDAGIYSKNGFIPFVDTIKGIFDVVGRSDLYYKWLQSGGSGSTYTNAQRPVLQKTLKGLTEGTTNEKKVKEALKKAVDLVKHPLRTYLDVAGTISNVAEEATRVGEFKRALEKGKNEKTAALDSREITLDFSRGGKVAKDINKVVAFFNAELQGLDKMFTSFKERPLATTVKGLAYLTIPAMILRALQDEEKLDKVPQWEKDEYFIIFAGDTPIKLPKPQGLGQLFATIPERIIDFIKTQDKDAFDGLVQRLITSYIPIDSTTSIFPNFFLPLIENSANYSFFRQQPIVKQSLQNRSPKYQYDENTSTIAKKVGEATNTSPKKIDNLISGYLGNLGKDIANIAGAPFDVYDSITDKNKDEKEYQSLNSKLKKIPVVKGFIASDTASKKIDEFYDSKAKANTDYTDAKFKYSDTKMTPKQEKELEYLKSVNSLYNKAYNDMKDIEEQIDDVSKSNRSNEYKKNMLEKLKKQKDKIAEETQKEADKLKAKNTLITQAEQRAKLK